MGPNALVRTRKFERLLTLEFIRSSVPSGITNVELRMIQERTGFHVVVEGNMEGSCEYVDYNRQGMVLWLGVGRRDYK
jgi:hypothetical protein